MPFFSVLIPLYNKEKFIKNTLQSVLNQTFSDFEIIIINDGSTDDSKQVVHEFHDTRIRYFAQKNQGVSVARNRGIEEATAPYIAFLDADDIWYPNHLEVIFNLITAYPNQNWYVNRYQIQFVKDNIYTPKYPPLPENFQGIVPDFFEASLVDRIAWTSTVVISKSTFQQVDGFNPRISSGEDLDLWIRIGIHFPIVISNTITGTYIFDAKNSLAKSNILQKKLPDLEIFKKHEWQIPSLKLFLDLYRIEFALHFKIKGHTDKTSFYLKNVSRKNIPTKTFILLKMPSIVLKPLFYTKQLLKRIGFNFSIYH